jgi:hypothetical protein
MPAASWCCAVARSLSSRLVVRLLVPQHISVAVALMLPVFALLCLGMQALIPLLTVLAVTATWSLLPAMFAPLFHYGMVLVPTTGVLVVCVQWQWLPAAYFLPVGILYAFLHPTIRQHFSAACRRRLAAYDMAMPRFIAFFAARMPDPLLSRDFVDTCQAFVARFVGFLVITSAAFTLLMWLSASETRFGALPEDMAMSGLRDAGFKNFLRLRFANNGSLDVFPILVEDPYKLPLHERTTAFACALLSRIAHAFVFGRACG